MKILIFLFVLGIIPVSASGYQYYELQPYNAISKDPTVCYISFEFVQDYEKVTKQSIDDWQNSLKVYTKNPDAWNIYYKHIPINHYDDINDNVYSLGCDIFVDYVEDVYANADEISSEVNGSTGPLVSGHMLIEISTSSGLSYEQLVSTTTHELGHAFGLGHYITDEDELKQQWDNGINVPSIMIEDAISVGVERITELDLQKMVQLYGKDGFEELPPVIPDWIRTIFKYYGDGQIHDQELVNAMKYLVENGIIPIN